MNNRISGGTKTGEDQQAKKILSLSYKDHESFVSAYTSNVGKGGLFIKTSNPLPEGESFILKLKLPGLIEAFKINCEVIWSNKDRSRTDMPVGMGLKFVDMDKNERLLLDKYIKATSAR